MKYRMMIESPFIQFAAALIVLGLGCTPTERNFGGASSSSGSSSSSSSGSSAECASDADCAGAVSECTAPGCSPEGICIELPANEGLPCGNGVCQDGICNCPSQFSQCNGICADISTDSQNCGQCGHDCMGSACSGGLCAPQLIASNQGGVSDMAVNANGLFWSNSMSGEIVFYSKMDGTVNALAKSQNSPGPIALSAINVFWANQSPNSPALMKMPLAGGNPTSMAIVNNAPIDIAFGGGDLYWLEHDGGTKGFVKRIAQAGGGNPNSLFSSNAEPKAIDVSVGDVYWSDASPNDPSIKLTKSGGGTNTIIPMLGNPADLIVFQSYIYFIDAGNATVNRAPVAGGQVEPLYAGPPWPRHIGVDAKYVYWTSDSGTVTRVPLGGGMAEDIAIKFKDLGAIAVDDTFVFFADQQSSVYAARK